MKRLFKLFLVFIVLSLAVASSAQQSAIATRESVVSVRAASTVPATGTRESLEKRIETLEAQLGQMRDELERFKASSHASSLAATNPQPAVASVTTTNGTASTRPPQDRPAFRETLDHRGRAHCRHDKQSGNKSLKYISLKAGQVSTKGIPVER